MRRHPLLPLCALLAVLLAGSLHNIRAQEAQESADLVLLIDGSENVGATNFPRVRDLALRILEGLDVGRDTIRVALAIYSIDPNIQFYLNSYDSKAEVLDVVKGLTFTGGDESNLGAALEEVAESLLAQTAGGRAEEGVPQTVVIISAGPSTDDTGAGDRALKMANVITLGVAIGGTSTATLETVVVDKSFVLSAPDYRTLASVGDQLLPYIRGVAQRTIVIQNEFTEALAVGKRDIIFLLDSTMGATAINAVREFIKRFVDMMPIGPDQVQVGVAQFSNTARLEMDLNSYGSREGITAALGRIRARPGQIVNTGAALDFVRTNMLRADKGSRIEQGVPQLMILMTTKKSSDSVAQPAQALQRMGVLTMAAGSKAYDGAELKQIAFDESLVFALKDFRMLLRNPKIIISPLSTLSGEVVPEGPTEPVVEITTVQMQRVVRDIVFLVDGSSYVGSSNLPYVREFITNVINQLDVRPDRVQIGLMQFAERPRIEFYLNTHNNKQDVLNSISQLRLTGGSVLNTGAALNYALSNVFQTSSGSRRRHGVQQVLILITGGPAQDEVKRVADNVALAGVLTFTVSSGQADEELLRTVAFVPNLAYHKQSFSSLPSVAQEIITPLKTVVGDTNLTDTEIVVETVITGAERDVAFLIDGSDNVRTDFPYIRDFIIKVIEPLDIGVDRVRISVVQHSEKPTPMFYLDTYKTKDEVIRAVNGMTFAGGQSLNTGSALKFMKDTILSERHGSRATRSVPQFLIVLTGGRSRDNVREPAGALKTEGVVPFGVGVKNADPKQIEAISHNPSFAFNVKEFSELGTVQQKLNNYVSLPKEQLQVVLEQVELDSNQRDIVFLLDGSDDTKRGFPAMRNFVLKVVEALNVGESIDRVAVVQYSGDPQTHFSLNTYTEKQDVLTSIQQLRHMGGRPPHTGAALEYVRKHIFIESSGGRPHEGVPQILILLSGGRSQDDVASAATALKQERVVPFSIGSRNADILELQMIADMPSYALTVPSFDDLESIHQQLMSFVKSVPPQPRPAPQTVLASEDKTESIQRDIVFLLDGSDKMQNAFEAMRDLIKRLVERLDVDENRDRISIVQYSGDSAVQFYLNTYKTKQEVIDAIQAMRHKGGSPLNTGQALKSVRDTVFAVSSGSRHQDSVPQILILLTGGQSNDNVRNAMRSLKEINVIAYVVGMRRADTMELSAIARTPSHIFFATDLNELSGIHEPLFTAIERANMHNVPIRHDTSKRDIVFLLDGSDDSWRKFTDIQDFVRGIVLTLNLEEDKDRVSVVQYSDTPETNFDLKSYSTQSEILGAITGFSHKGGYPHNLGAALQYMKDTVFTPAFGSRHLEGVPQILILLSGGRSGDDIRIPVKQLKEMGVISITVGTAAADTLELQTMSQTPKHALKTNDYGGLSTIQRDVLSLLKETTQQMDPAATMKGFDSKKKDVVFLIDGSYDSRNGFEGIRGFVEKMIESLNVEATQDRVAFVQYSRDATANFYLNSYSSKNDVLNSIRTIRHKLGRPLNTGNALEFVRNNVFAAPVGGRHADGVPQYLFVFSGGRSGDDVRGPAQSLRENAITTFNIGTQNADTLELQTISFTPAHSFSVTNFNDLDTIQSSVKDIISGAREPAELPTVTDTSDVSKLELPRADVAFLIDGSDDMQKKAREIKDFVKQFVEQMEVGPEKTQIALIQYSDKPTTAFYLNTYSLKRDTLSYLSDLKLNGGRKVNTGEALDYVKKNVFTSSSGSRADMGVLQILILISGRKSQDDFLVPLDNLRNAGVVVFSVGVGNAEQSEMESLAHSPSDAYTIKDIFDYSVVREKLLSAVASHKSTTSPGLGE